MQNFIPRNDHMNLTNTWQIRIFTFPFNSGWSLWHWGRATPAGYCGTTQVGRPCQSAGAGSSRAPGWSGTIAYAHLPSPCTNWALEVSLCCKWTTFGLCIGCVVLNWESIFNFYCRQFYLHCIFGEGSRSFRSEQVSVHPLRLHTDLQRRRIVMVYCC